MKLVRCIGAAFGGDDASERRAPVVAGAIGSFVPAHLGPLAA
jgi:hypothetical protein